MNRIVSESGMRRQGIRWRVVHFALFLVSMGLSLHLSVAADQTSSRPRIASGDITSERAVLWGQIETAADMEVEYSRSPYFTDSQRIQGPFVDEDSDFSGHVEVQNLAPATRYYYRLVFRERTGSPNEKLTVSAVGTFQTAPLASSPTAVRFVFSGDLGGQGFCRQEDQGYRIFSAMLEQAPDFFVATGDFIYADGTCAALETAGWANVPGAFASIADPAVDWMDPTVVNAIYRNHWRYQLNDEPLLTLLRQVPLYAQWDDHEVINDAGWSWDYWNADTQTRLGFQNVVEAGREAFFQHLPLRRHSEERSRLYRRFSWGQDLDVFLLDGRSYRSRNDAPDGPDKTLLGFQQLAWLKDGLAESQATWKIVSMDVPLAVPRGDKFGRDGWANGEGADPPGRTGFEHELLDLMGFLDGQQVTNVVFLAGDVHFAAQLRYAVDVNGDGKPLLLHELIAGPMAARRREPPPSFDPTLRPTVLYAEGGMFNFGQVTIVRQPDGLPHLIARVYDEKGELRPGSTLDLTPERPALQRSHTP